MGTSYGTAYSTRSSEEGYGERYGDAVKAVLEKRDQKIEMERGGSTEIIETVDSGNLVQLTLCSHVHMGSNFLGCLREIRNSSPLLWKSCFFWCMTVSGKLNSLWALRLLQNMTFFAYTSNGLDAYFTCRSRGCFLSTLTNDFVPSKLHVKKCF